MEIIRFKNMDECDEFLTRHIPIPVKKILVKDLLFHEGEIILLYEYVHLPYINEMDELAKTLINLFSAKENLERYIKSLGVRGKEPSFRMAHEALSAHIYKTCEWMRGVYEGILFNNGMMPRTEEYRKEYVNEFLSSMGVPNEIPCMCSWGERCSPGGPCVQEVQKQEVQKKLLEQIDKLKKKNTKEG